MKQLFRQWYDLSEIKKELTTRNWFPATSGNISIKVSHEPLTFLITASGKDKTKTTPDDFLLVDHLGVPVLETELRPSAETILHTHIYNNTNAGCVLHVHTTDNNVITNLYSDAVTLQNQEIIKGSRYLGRRCNNSHSYYRKPCSYPNAWRKLPQAYTGRFGGSINP